MDAVLDIVDLSPEGRRKVAEIVRQAELNGFRGSDFQVHLRLNIPLGLGHRDVLFQNGFGAGVIGDQARGNVLNYGGTTARGNSAVGFVKHECGCRAAQPALTSQEYENRN